jgi:hypothetical protein
MTFLFCEGLFYRYSPAGYVVVQPPIGAMVPMLPPGYTTVFINGMPYYYYGYTYYTMAPGGYVVAAPPAVPMAPPAVAPVAYPAPQVAAPQTAPQAAPAPVAPAPASSPSSVEGDNPDTFEIHIPNGDGSFTLVTLKKTEKGFLGPQGEFYQDHPTVDQLKERYVKGKK